MTQTRSFAKPIRTLVIKIGSSILAGENGLYSDHINALASQIAKLKAQIPNIVIVSSGAVASGFKLLGFKSRPKDIISKQASAAVGQARLIWTYEQAFSKHNLNVAQILLTKNDLANRKGFLYARSALKKLLELNVIAIINENDTIVIDELKYIETFGDNDNLGAMVAGIVDADLLLILSDVNGLYTANPSEDKNAMLIHEVKYIDEKIMSLAGESVSKVGTGGMKSKLNATKKALSIGCDVAIIKGCQAQNIQRFFAGEQIGTYFSHITHHAPLKKRKFWLQNATIPKGSVIIDDGAKKAILAHKSLLAKGIRGCEGRFAAGDVVLLVDTKNQEIARAKVRYSSNEILKIMGFDSSEISKILGYKFCDEIVHIDDGSLL